VAPLCPHSIKLGAQAALLGSPGDRAIRTQGGASSKLELTLVISEPAMRFWLSTQVGRSSLCKQSVRARGRARRHNHNYNGDEAWHPYTANSSRARSIHMMPLFWTARYVRRPGRLPISWF